MTMLALILLAVAAVLALGTPRLVGYVKRRAYLADLWRRAISVPLPAYADGRFIDRLITLHRETFGTAVAVLWTDVVDPATLTGYARASLEDYERRKGTLARFLPNRTVQGIVARFIKGATGLLDVARFRAFDAEIEIGKRPSGQRVTLELPALGDMVPVSEYEQLRGNGGTPSDEAVLRMVQATTDQQMQKVADAIERMRGVVINTGIATVTQDNFHTADDFGRSGTHSVTAATAWSDTTVDRLADLQSWSDTYEDTNGVMPGAILMSRRVFRALAAGDGFQIQLGNGASRTPTEQQVRDIVTGEGLPDIVIYNRRVGVNGTATKVLPDDSLYLLPEPVEVDDELGTELGGTFWGRTLSSTEPGWEIPDDQQPGIVAGVWRNDKPPMGIEVIADAIGLPVLANANLSFKADVL